MDEIVFGDGSAQLSPHFFKHINIQETSNQEIFLQGLSKDSLIPCTFSLAGRPHAWICRGAFDNLIKMHELLSSVFKAYTDSITEEKQNGVELNDDTTSILSTQITTSSDGKLGYDRGPFAVDRHQVTYLPVKDVVEQSNRESNDHLHKQYLGDKRSSESHARSQSLSCNTKTDCTYDKSVSDKEESDVSLANSPVHTEDKGFVTEAEGLGLEKPNFGANQTLEGTSDKLLSSINKQSKESNTNSVQLKPSSLFPLGDSPKAVKGRREKKITTKRKHGSSRQSKVCSICSKTFSTSSNYFRHMQAAHQGKRFPCDMCLKSFTCKLSRDRHIRVEHKQLRCKSCKKIFHSREAMSSHTCCERDRDSCVRRCDQCGKAYSNLGNLNKHIKTCHDNVVHKCEFCTRSLKSKDMLLQHIRLIHKLHKCPKFNCDFVSSVVEDYAEHMMQLHGYRDVSNSTGKEKTKESSKVAVIKRVQRQREPVGCDQCEKIFSSRSNLGKHIRAVHQQLKEQCEECGKKFVNKERLSEHVKRDHQGFQHTCSMCSMTFPHKRNLARHQELIHKQISIDHTSHCMTCGKVFLQESNLQRHIKRKHQGQSLACAKCNRLFTSEKSLQDHNKVEHENHRYKCAHCAKLFKYKNKLKEHEIAVHTSLKPFCCEECGEEFSRRSGLAYHTLRAHGHKLHTGYEGVFNKEIAQQNWERNRAVITKDQDGSPLKVMEASLVAVPDTLLTQKQGKKAPKKTEKATVSEQARSVSERRYTTRHRGEHNYAETPRDPLSKEAVSILPIAPSISTQLAQDNLTECSVLPLCSQVPTGHMNAGLSQNEPQGVPSSPTQGPVNLPSWGTSAQGQQYSDFQTLHGSQGLHHGSFPASTINYGHHNEVGQSTVLPDEVMSTLNVNIVQECAPHANQHFGS